MNLTRRTLIRTGRVAALGAMLARWQPEIAMAQATPAGRSASSEALYQTLLTSTISSPLFPSDTGPLEIVEWIDSGDSDLDGAVGGLLVQDTAKEGDDALLAVMIVHPDPETARARLTSDSGESMQTVEILGRPGVWIQEGEYSLLGVAEGSMIVSAIGSIAGAEPVNVDGRDGPALSSNGETDFRAMANLVGTLDHIRMVLTEGEAG